MAEIKAVTYNKKSKVEKSSAILQKRSERNTKKRKKFSYKFMSLGLGVDLPLVILILTLLSMGLIMLFSASFARGFYDYGDSYHFIKDQAMFALVGVIAMFFLSYIDYHLFYKFAWLVFGVATLLLGIVLIDSFALSEGVAQRWISIGPISFQPSELAKFAIVVILAYILSKNQKNITSIKLTVLPCMACTGILTGLVLAERHLSGTIIMASLAVLIMFVGGIQVRWFVIIGAIAGTAIIFLLLNSDVFAYTLDRIEGWRDPFNPPLNEFGEPIVDTYQTVQSIYAIGSGELLGVGLGQSTQKHLYLPASQNDFIFSIICEELGFIGAMLVIGLFIAFVWRGVVVSINAKDKFGMLLGLGMTFTVGIQAAFNICVATNAFPNTGISLPFFSYGGTALLVTLGEMGVLLAVSRNSYTEKI